MPHLPMGAAPEQAKRGVPSPPQNALRSMVCLRICQDAQGQDSLREDGIRFASLFEFLCLGQGELSFDAFTSSQA